MIRRVNFGLLLGILFIASAAVAQTRVTHLPVYSAPARPLRAPTMVQTIFHAGQRGAMFAPPVLRASERYGAARPVVVRLPAVPPGSNFVNDSPNSQSAPPAAPARDEFLDNSGFTPVFPIASDALLGAGQVLNGVPGLGFDYSHLAAINQFAGERAIVDPVTQHELAITEQLLQDEQGVGTSAFIPFYGAATYSQPVEYEQQPPPQIIVLQQPAPQTQSGAQTAPPAAVAPEQTPLPPVGEFTLILKTGEQIKAVAFTRQGDSIVYITKDGTRASFPELQLDVAATEKINEQHGTPLKLSL